MGFLFRYPVFYLWFLSVRVSHNTSMLTSVWFSECLPSDRWIFCKKTFWKVCQDKWFLTLTANVMWSVSPLLYFANVIIWLVALFCLLSCSLLILGGIISVNQDQLAGKVTRSLAIPIRSIPSGPNTSRWQISNMNRRDFLIFVLEICYKVV